MKHCLTVLALAVAPAVLAGGAAADLILTNGRVYTLDPAKPWAEAMAIAGDRILAVGAVAEVRALAGADTRTIDLAGGFALPGFNDAHVHTEGTGALLIGANLLDVHEPKTFVDRIRGAAGRLPKGSWITRGDWGAYEQWKAGSSGAQGAQGAQGAGPFTPHRDLIDPVSPDHPVFVNRFDRSMYLANSLALKLAGITESTPAPEGGEIVKDASGRLTGIVKGSAADLVRKAIPATPLEQRLVQVRAVMQEAREGGLTTIQDLTSAEQLQAYQ
ncbi:MAG: amidohydrolase, partial [Vicinamibacterales bacterium]